MLVLYIDYRTVRNKLELVWKKLRNVQMVSSGDQCNLGQCDTIIIFPSVFLWNPFWALLFLGVFLQKKIDMCHQTCPETEQQCGGHIKTTFKVAMAVTVSGVSSSQMCCLYRVPSALLSGLHWSRSASGKYVLHVSFFFLHIFFSMYLFYFYITDFVFFFLAGFVLSSITVIL